MRLAVASDANVRESVERWLFFQAEDGIRDIGVTGVQTCALPISNFRTGHLTICTLHPMRSVPHRVVCLLGLDDAVFPRKAPRDGDDLLLDDERVGERDPRAEDRQLLLDALMAAQERLLITFTGNDERTNAPRPPAVPVGELLEVADRTVRTADGRPAREHVVVRHPLQPF